MTYEYTCPNGHNPTAPMALTRCPGMVNGKPCPGPLRQVGAGSHGPRKSTAAAQSVSADLEKMPAASAARLRAGTHKAGSR